MKKIPIFSRRLLPITLLLLGTACAGSEYVEPVQVTEVVPRTAQPYPVPTQSTATLPDPAEVFAAAFDQLEQGRILYNPPTEMTVSQKERVEARITLSESISLEEELKGRGQPVEESIQVSRFMKVVLLGEHFSITPLNSAEQALLPEGYTEWAWDVVPLKGGDQTLVLRVTARVKVQGYPDEQRDLEIIERQIHVRVNWGEKAMGFVLNNLEWLVPLILLPILLALANQIRVWMESRR